MVAVYVIALTGGIASGKSLVAKRLAELGAVHIDADALAREVVQPGTEGLAEIVREFGPDILLPDGALDRAALGAIIFSDAERRGALNGITHHRVRELMERRLAEARAADPDAVVIYDVPLLAEAGPGKSAAYDAVVVVHAETAERIRRMVEDRGMSRQEALHRLNSQASDTDRLAIADVVLDNTSTVEALLGQVDALWDTLQARSALR